MHKANKGNIIYNRFHLLTTGLVNALLKWISEYKTNRQSSYLGTHLSSQQADCAVKPSLR